MEIQPTVIIMTLVNFFIFVLILKHFFWDKIQKAIEDRENYIEDNIAKAEDDMEKARVYLLENERILKLAKKQGKKLIEERKAKADRIYKEIIAEANKEAQTIIERGKLDVERDKEKARDELRKEVVDIAMNLSYKALGNTIKDENQKILIDDFITKVGSKDV